MCEATLIGSQLVKFYACLTSSQLPTQIFDTEKECLAITKPNQSDLLTVDIHKYMPHFFALTTS